MIRKPVGIWIRVSTDRQKEGDSPEVHERRARMYADLKGWEVAKIYHLEGFSGKSVIDYPEAKRMLEDVKNGQIQGLIFSKLARLARNTRELLDFADYFESQGADLISLDESIDTSSPAGRFFYTLLAAIGQWEREEVAARVKASVPVRAQMGKPLGGAAPYGYQWVDKELGIDEQEAPIRKLMFELFVEHQKKLTVAKLLNSRGYRTRKGAQFSATTVTRLLRDPIAKGLRRANYTQSLGKGQKWEQKPQEEWVFIPAPAIVSVELWEQVNAILDGQEQKNKRTTKRVKHLFSGLVICHCGSKMYVRSKSPKYVCQSCKNKIEPDTLEQIFHDELRNYLLSEEEISQELGKAEKEIQAKQHLLQGLEQEAATLQNRLNTLVDMVHTGQLPKDGFGKHYQPVFEQLEQIQESIPTLQGEIDYLQNGLNASDTILHEAKNLQARWYSLSQEDKRAIAETIIESVVVGEQEVEFNLLHLPTSIPSDRPPPKEADPASMLVHETIFPRNRTKPHPSSLIGANDTHNPALAAITTTPTKNVSAVRSKCSVTSTRSLARLWTGSTCMSRLRLSPSKSWPPSQRASPVSTSEDVSKPPVRSSLIASRIAPVSTPMP